jgi:hypothetical protein
VLDFSLISQFPDETVKISPAFQVGKIFAIFIEKPKYLIVQTIGLFMRLKPFFAKGDLLCSVSSGNGT